ncbi:MAG: tetratricopeptide repeat protein [Pseudomonadales bacterium]
MKLGWQLALLTLSAAFILAILTLRAPSPSAVWLTPDQQGRLAYDKLEWASAAELFENPMWKGTAAYSMGEYEGAAETFGRIPNAKGFYNRGNAFMKSFDYGKAIASYELAVAEAPEWLAAAENLRLANYVLRYIEDTRDQADTGDESEISADGYKFDNEQKRGEQMTITDQSTIELASAEKWMRTVDTKTRDFLRSRFELEARMSDRAAEPAQ